MTFPFEFVAPASIMGVVLAAASSDEVCEPGADPGTGTKTGQWTREQLRRVLVVHDDPLQQKLLRLYIEKLGYRVQVANDGAEALAMACRFPPDAIVSDVMMPGLDGFALCRAIRSDPRMTRIPVILVSVANSSVEDQHLARSVGASNLFLSTPDFAEVRLALADDLS